MILPEAIEVSLKNEQHLAGCLLHEKSEGLEKTRVYWHTVAYANTFYRADGHVPTILPQCDVFCKRQKGRGNDYDP